MIPFEANNQLALEASIASSITKAATADVVETWADVGPTGRDFANTIDAESPTYSRPNVIFDGVNDSLANAATPRLIPASGDWAFVCRFFTDNSTKDQSLLSQYVAASGNGRLIFRLFQGKPLLFLGNVGSYSTVLVTGGNLVTGQYHTFTARRVGGQFALRLDGAVVAAHSDADSGRQILQTSANIGRIVDPGLYFDGSITRIGVWWGTYSDAELVRIEGWAKGASTPLAVLSGGF